MSSMVAQAMGIYQKLNKPNSQYVEDKFDEKDIGEYFSDPEDVPDSKK